MRILVTRFPLESARGGAETHTVTLMKALQQRGHELLFLGSCPVLLEMLSRERIPCEQLEIGPPPVSLQHALSFFWRRKKMKQQLCSTFDALSEKGKFDAVLMLSLSEKLLLTDHVLEKGGKVFWVEHDRVGRWLSQNPFLHELKRRSSLVTTIVVSELSKRLYVDLGWSPESVTSIHNGIDLKRFHGTSMMERPDMNGIHVGCVARLSPDKGIDVLLAAMEDLHDMPLTIVGEGKESEFVNRWIENVALKENISPPRLRLISRVEDLGSFYRSLDVFVLPSRLHDPFGLVAAEAMSQGIPVIVTDQCGIAQSLHSGVDGMIVRAGNASTLKEALESLRDPAIRKVMGEEGRKTAQREFPADAMVNRYEALLQK